MSTKSDRGGAVRGRQGSRGSRGSMKAASLVVGLTIVAGSTAACAKINEVKAMFKFKQANQAYQGQFYDRSAELYEETVAANPNNNIVYFYLGNSYDNLYKPSEKGQAENDALIEKAVENYTLAVERLDSNDPTEAKIKGLALQYLMAAYGPDKLDDPVKAEPVMIRLIEQEPNEPAYYFQLAKLYEDAGEYEAAEKVYLAGRDARPADPAGYMQVAGYYDRSGEFEKEIAAFEQRSQQEPNNPEAFYTIATQYWDQAFRGSGVTEAEKRTYVDNGIKAIDEAIRIRPDYVEAIVYKNLLLRLQANLETNPARQQALIRQADVLRDQAEEIRKKKATGVGD
jgi:tetratricopeptide (TPR) repeat protein